jgi:hypothetical protein
MSGTVSRLNSSSVLSKALHSQLWVGRIVEVAKNGAVSVDPGNGSDPVWAQSVVRIDRAVAAEGVSVLLAYPSGPATQPVILGVVRDEACAPEPSEASADLELPLGQPYELVVDEDRKVLRARRELELVCGKSSITLRKNGQVEVRGVEIVSRATGLNKIRGGAVRIN